MWKGGGRWRGIVGSPTARQNGNGRNLFLFHHAADGSPLVSLYPLHSIVLSSIPSPHPFASLCISTELVWLGSFSLFFRRIAVVSFALLRNGVYDSLLSYFPLFFFFSVAPVWWREKGAYITAARYIYIYIEREFLCVESLYPYADYLYATKAKLPAIYIAHWKVLVRRGVEMLFIYFFLKTKFLLSSFFCESIYIYIYSIYICNDGEKEAL